jgi:hypothetical protein
MRPFHAILGAGTVCLALACPAAGQDPSTTRMVIGYGGDAVVSSATGLSRNTIRSGRRELAEGGAPAGRLRRPGAGRPEIETTQPGLRAALEALVDPVTRGDPTSLLRWTCKSKAKLAAALTAAGWRVSATTVGRLLHDLGYRLQALQKTLEGTAHPDRDAQFEHINATAAAFLQQQQPVISVDTKKKELNGEFRTAGRDWTRIGEGFRTELDRRITVMQRLRDRLDGCIGCGCLSLATCRLHNPGDAAAEGGAGPRLVRE